ncbi:MAG: hypothetical protein KDI56_13495, partial [Xanthomonadales bacterium]|nr:hypothetical protein [Xanthomonadales bacterium]
MNMRLSSGLGLLVLWSAQVGAASFTVDSNLDLVDDLPGDGVCDVGPAAPGNPCTLRAAIMEAEANGQADTILIPAGMSINLTLAGSGGTENGDLNIGTDMVIAGFEGAPPGNPALLPLIDASAIADRHFQILGGQVTLRGLRLQGGNSSNSGGSVRIGGGSGTAVRIEHVQLRDNRAAARAGAVLSGGSASLIVEDSLFLRNDGGTAAAGGLAVETNSQVVIRRSTLLDNRASAMPSSTLAVLGNASLRIEDSTVDGSLVRPPIAGLEGAVGIVQFGTSELVLRNVTVSNFAETALDLRDLDGNERTRIGSSVLESDGTACVATGTNLAAADVQIAYSQVRHQSGCLAFYLEGVRNGLADLGPLTDDPPPRLTFSRPPLGPLANVVDRGTPVDDPPADPDLACTDNDQRGGPRPLDADLDGVARCDVGAIETAAPLPFVVNHYADDLTDDLPGDGQCATVPVPGIGPVCTLRAAIMETNALPGLDYIRFAPSAIPVALTLPVTGSVGGALRITEALAIEGNLVNGRPATTISGQMVGQRLLQVPTTDQTVYLRNLALRGGDAVGQVGGAIVLASGELLLDRMELFDNFAGAGGGALAVIG